MAACALAMTGAATVVWRADTCVAAGATQGRIAH